MSKEFQTVVLLDSAKASRGKRRYVVSYRETTDNSFSIIQKLYSELGQPVKDKYEAVKTLVLTYLPVNSVIERIYLYDVLYFCVCYCNANGDVQPMYRKEYNELTAGQKTDFDGLVNHVKTVDLV